MLVFFLSHVIWKRMYTYLGLANPTLKDHSVVNNLPFTHIVLIILVLNLSEQMCMTDLI